MIDTETGTTAGENLIENYVEIFKFIHNFNFVIYRFCQALHSIYPFVFISQYHVDSWHVGVEKFQTARQLKRS